nr:MAG TPA: hypothetical protein [Caudoviricetes sp.]
MPITSTHPVRYNQSFIIPPLTHSPHLFLELAEWQAFITVMNPFQHRQTA